MKQRISRWKLLFSVGLMVVMVLGLWATSGSGYAGYFQGDDVVVMGGKMGIGTETPSSTLQVAGPIATAFQSVTLNNLYPTYTMTANDSVIAVTAFDTPRTIYLPDADGIAGRQYTIKCLSSVDVIVDADGGQTIDGVADYTLANTNDFVTVVSDGANWHIVGK